MGQVLSLAVVRDFIHIRPPVKREEVSDNDLLKATLINRSQLAPNGCWEWTRGTRAGYGMISVKGRDRSAHRLSYELWNGEIPEGMLVRHTCDNPSCCNPNHLIVGTVADNTADREARRRRIPVRGEMMANSKLTSADVEEILSSKESGIAMARKFNVSNAHISRIRAGLAWPHLQQASGL